MKEKAKMNLILFIVLTVVEAGLVYMNLKADGSHLSTYAGVIVTGIFVGLAIKYFNIYRNSKD